MHTCSCMHDLTGIELRLCCVSCVLIVNVTLVGAMVVSHLSAHGGRHLGQRTCQMLWHSQDCVHVYQKYGKLVLPPHKDGTQRWCIHPSGSPLCRCAQMNLGKSILHCGLVHSKSEISGEKKNSCLSSTELTCGNA